MLEHGARYVLDCIVKLPIGICEAVADKVRQTLFIIIALRQSLLKFNVLYCS